MKKVSSISVRVLAIILLASLPISGRSAEPIKLGATEPLSGTFKNIGERYLEGVQYAAKILNQHGGVLGRQIEVIPIDSELKPDVATRKATALILKDQVKFFCGGQEALWAQPCQRLLSKTMPLCSVTGWMQPA